MRLETFNEVVIQKKLTISREASASEECDIFNNIIGSTISELD